MRAKVNGTTLYFDVEGAELAVDGTRLRPRPTIIALHGGPGFDQGYLRPGIAPLAADAQVLFVDLRGQGRSDPVGVDTCTLEQMADDVAALCDALGIRRPVVFGHSAGGFVALQLALRHPGVAGGLVLCHTAPTLAPAPDASAPPSVVDRAGPAAAAAAARVFGGDASAEAGEAFERLVLPHYAAPAHTDVPREVMALTRIDGPIVGHFFSHLARRYDVRSRLGDIAVPALVIAGRHDWVCPPAAGRALAEGIPVAELVELPDAGHFGFSETPEPFLRAVRGFLGRLSGTEPACAPAPRGSRRPAA